LSAPNQSRLFDRWGLPARREQERTPAAPATDTTLAATHPFRNRAPLAATRDPNISKIAERRFTASGIRSAKKLALLEFLRWRTEPMTSREIAVAMDWERHDVGKRLPDMRDDGLVENRPERLWTITGEPALTWVIAVGSSAVSTCDQTAYHQPATLTSVSTQGQTAAPPAEPITCARCKGAGVLHISSGPDVCPWCDEGAGKPCADAERLRAVDPDAYQTWLKLQSSSTAPDVLIQNKLSEGRS